MKMMSNKKLFIMFENILLLFFVYTFTDDGYAAGKRSHVKPARSWYKDTLPLKSGNSQTNFEQRLLTIHD